jgi:hypothetical protein
MKRMEQRGWKLADLIRCVGLTPTPANRRAFRRIRANGERWLKAPARLPRPVVPMAAWAAGGYPGDTKALLGVVIPLLQALRGVPKGRTFDEIYAALAPLISSLR